MTSCSGWRSSASSTSWGVWHEPLLALPDRADRRSDACFFVCRAAPLDVAGVPEAASAWIFLLAALLAGLPLAGWFRCEPAERAMTYGLSAVALLVIPPAFVAGLGSWVGRGLLQPPVGPLMAASRLTQGVHQPRQLQSEHSPG